VQTLRVVARCLRRPVVCLQVGSGGRFALKRIPSPAWLIVVIAAAIRSTPHGWIGLWTSAPCPSPTGWRAGSVRGALAGAIMDRLTLSGNTIETGADSIWRLVPT
jgi:hypothetical protein